MKRAVLLFAWSCFAVSVVIHAASFIGVSLFEKFVFLHFGVFVLGIPAVFSAKNRNIRRGPWWPPGASLRALTEGGPRWGARALIVGYVYFVANFVALFVLSGIGKNPKNTRYATLPGAWNDNASY